MAHRCNIITVVTALVVGLHEEQKGVVFVDESLCLETQSVIHRVTLRAGKEAPLAGLRLLLLRPVPETRQNEFSVVFCSEELPGKAGASNFDGISVTGVSANCTGNEFTNTLLDGEVPAGTEGMLLFSWLQGHAGDCLGWYIEPSGSGSLDSISHASAFTRKVHWEPTVGTLRSLAVKGNSLEFGQFVGESFSINWYVTPPSYTLQDLQRSFRLQRLHETIDVKGMVPSSTSTNFKHDLVELFSAESWSQEAVVEVGAASGATTMILSLLFRLVHAVELHMKLDMFRTGHIAGLRNVVCYQLDTGQQYTYGLLAPNDISVAIIDGDHDEQHVFFDTLGVLQDIPCCVGVIVYHDFCDKQVFDGIQRFVDGGLLQFRQGMGVPAWEKWWCSGGRHEGAIFDVLRDRPDWHAALDQVRLQYAGWTSMDKVSGALNGSTWRLQLNYDIGVLVLALPPRRSTVKLMDKTGTVVKKVLDAGLIKLEWDSNVASTRWTTTSLQAWMYTSRAPGMSPAAVLTFDREQLSFILEVSQPARLLDGLPQTVIGIRRHFKNIKRESESAMSRLS